MGSPSGRISRTEVKQWFLNAIRFLAPLGVLYLTAVLGVMSQPNHLLSLADFVPSQFTTGAMVLWIMNTAYDFLRKLGQNTV